MNNGVSGCRCVSQPSRSRLWQSPRKSMASGAPQDYYQIMQKPKKVRNPKRKVRNHQKDQQLLAPKQLMRYVARDFFPPLTLVRHAPELDHPRPLQQIHARSMITIISAMGSATIGAVVSSASICTAVWPLRDSFSKRQCRRQSCIQTLETSTQERQQRPDSRMVFVLRGPTAAKRFIADC